MAQKTDLNIKHGGKTFDLGSYTGADHPAHAALLDASSYAAIEANPTILGLVGILDPARPEVKQSISDCRRAGIFVIMITGDVKETATAIASTIGIVNKNDKDLNQRSFTGKEFFE